MLKKITCHLCLLMVSSFHLFATGDKNQEDRNYRYCFDLCRDKYFMLGEAMKFVKTIEPTLRINYRKILFLFFLNCA